MRETGWISIGGNWELLIDFVKCNKMFETKAEFSSYSPYPDIHASTLEKKPKEKKRGGGGGGKTLKKEKKRRQDGGKDERVMPFLLECKKHMQSSTKTKYLKSLNSK
ncbi:hypothetical protein V6Z11_D10G153700 [Gossypium hirsutum]